MLHQIVKLICIVFSVEEYFSLVEVREYQNFSSFEFILVSNNVSNTVIKTGLQRRVGLDFIIWVNTKNIRVMIKNLELLQVQLSLVDI